MSEKFGVVRLDKVKATKVGNIFSVVKDEGILENGMVGAIGDLIEGDRELRTFEIPTVEDSIALVYHPEINYDESRISKNALENFFVPEGQPARAFELVKNDIYSVSKDMIGALATNVVVGNHLVVDGTTHLLKEIATPVGTEKFVAKIIDTEQIGTSTTVGQAGVISRIVDFVVIEVLSN